MRSFRNWDIYYLQEYARSFNIHGDGIPYLLDYRDDESHFSYVVMKKDIGESPEFKGLIKSGKFFDLETPYGYGGPLYDSPISKKSEKAFLKEMTDLSLENGIISQFVRFHPLLNNYNMPLVFETRYLHDTIFIDTENPEIIFNNLDSKNRNMIRKAEKSGITISRRPIEDYDDFLPIYRETMERDNAEKYYFFDESYFRSQLALKENACIFYAIYEGRPIGGAIMYFNDRFMHYHLAGTLTEYRKYAPGNLLLYEAALWASQMGIKKLHLGGGMSDNDNLFRFKKKFNKNGRLPFVIGRTIFDKGGYDRLMKIREENDHSFDSSNNRMIQYRA